MKKQYKNYKVTGILLIFLSLMGCTKFIEVEAPETSVSEGNVFKTDANAISVLTGIYMNMSNAESNTAFSGDGIGLLNYLPSLSADELTLVNNGNALLSGYYKNMVSTIVIGQSGFWNTGYFYIYSANAAIAGLTASNSITPSVKKQLLGEAYFVRALSYFYLTNLYGKVPMVKTTDYSVTSLLSRSEINDVYKFIIEDLLKSQNLLDSDFKNFKLLGVSEERTRPNKGAATALLARVYLYTGDWNKAEIESTKLISDKVHYSLNELDEVFLKNSKETIWSLQPIGTGENANTGAGKLYVLPITGTDGLDYPVYLNQRLYEVFEKDDPRSVKWIGTVILGGKPYYYPNKYKVGKISSPTMEYSVVLRLGEQYLIRAEARAMLSKNADAIEDVNIIRRRARGNNPTTILPDIPTNLASDQILSIIIHERQTELFTEWGHRWFDLKRTGTIDAVMQTESFLKGGVWKNSQALYPIPSSEIINNPNIIQNPGYQ